MSRHDGENQTRPGKYDQPPRGIRILHSLRKDPDWEALTPEELTAHVAGANRLAGSKFMRVVTGLPARGTGIEWQQVTFPDRTVPIRVYRPVGEHAGALPLVLHVHGGGFAGTAAQCDWGNSHLAAELPAVIVSVEHRLIAPDTPLTAAVDDDWDVLRHILDQPGEWGIDPARVILAGESGGALISALTAIRAAATGLPLLAQVLINPAFDLTDTMFDYPTMTRYAETPTLNLPRLKLFRRLAVPPGEDPRPLSPLYADLTGQPPALVVIPTLDPLADQGRRYAERLGDFGIPVQLSEYPGAPHAFIAMPGLVPQAKAARTDITAFLRTRLSDSIATRSTLDR
ncbi:alpha/beta hydrolase [Nocardia sp. NPDC004151]|uniref:alpha/beta hydrolase n=1 Tax=Nocardia sp. NPDC004151 TaxID=3364304 RepID=UPI00369E282A